MALMQKYDLLITNVQVVRPNHTQLYDHDIAIKDGKIVEVGANLSADNAAKVIDGKGHLAFPGAIDAHMHIGIYQSLDKDAPTESMAAASGGVTTAMTYIRTGSYYLNMGGSWRDFFPEVLRLSEGNYYVDYAYHVSPIESSQLDEFEYMAVEQGAPNFGEVFMFYGSHGLHGSSDNQRKWLMLQDGDNYDIAHFDQICLAAAKLQKKYPELAPYIQVSWHCETPELLRAYEAKAQASNLEGLEAYSAARPPFQEALAIAVAGSLAHHAELTQTNILHITSREAMDAALAVRANYPDMTVGMEVTAGHLIIDYETCTAGAGGKVNPPLRSTADRDYLWQHVLDGTIEWVITDHANCPPHMKFDADDPDNVWKARAGFGGTEYLLPGIFSEGTKRGLSPNRVAELVSWTPSRRMGVLNKGDIAAGFCADVVLLDPNEQWTIRGADSFSTQQYTPFEGVEVTGKVKQTFVRGELVFDNGEIVGERNGQYIKRPTATI